MANKRTIAVFLDPVLACNFRCKMCNFSNDSYVKEKMKGILKEEDLEQIAMASFKNALKLQIGCAAEPTLFNHNKKLIEIAKRYKVPHISMVTNGNLLTNESIVDYVNAGLNEFIISVHGVTKKTYENFMERGSFDLFHQTLALISEQKKSNPKLLLRINYTFNEDNFYELTDLFTSYKDYAIDVIQLRPIDKVGEGTVYNNYSLKKIEIDYKTISNKLKIEAEKSAITLIYPSSISRNEQQTSIVATANNSNYLMPFVFCYISPRFYWKEGFDYKNETFLEWKKRTGWNKVLFKNIFTSKNKLGSMNRNILNYSIDVN
ncbi:radical SAM protein [Flavobacterium soli]|uniref:radical SAM protein n=1 Tax=Flavobacterium soli TaxID=344881 RepID=UPI00146B9BE8|nr:radical SAM protein [Flavobacterium soli]